MNTFVLKLMASDHMVYEGESTSVVLPTTEGRVGVLAGHCNLIMAIVPGLLEFEPAGRGEPRLRGRQSVIVSEGLLKVENGEVVVLVDAAERPEDIDIERAGRSAERARKELENSRGHSARELTALSAELSRAMSRIKEAKKRHKF